MRHLLCYVAVLSAAVTYGPISQVSAQAAPSPVAPVFSGVLDLPGVVQAVVGVSSDKKAATVLFRNLVASVEGNSKQLIESRVQTISVPLVSGAYKSHLTQDIRDFVTIKGSSTASLIVVSGGKTSVIDLKASRAPDGSKPATSESADAAAKAAAKLPPANKPTLADVPTPSGAKQPVVDSFDFQTRIEGDLPSGATNRITLILVVESDQPNEGALVTIDSLDLAIVEPAAPASGK